MVVFDKPGESNTKQTVELAIEAARKNGIKHIVAASYRGVVAEELLKYADEFNIVTVAMVYGFMEKNPMQTEELEKLKAGGLKVLFTTHVLSGAERGISKKFGGVNPVELMAQTLKFFGQGTKVCVEISTMAIDSGLIPENERIMAIAGSAKGADTALIILPAHAGNIMDTKIDEIICKPKLS